MARDVTLISGGTDNHLILVDLQNKGITGKEAETALDYANITVNKNMIPYDPRSPFNPSGIRFGWFCHFPNLPCRESTGHFLCYMVTPW